MHKSAYKNVRDFANKYLVDLNGKDAKILDVGSMDINGSLKPIFEKSNWEYVGIDIASGKNVNVVLEDVYKFPFPDNHFDSVISSSCFEHNEMFWLTFKEMVRVAKSGSHMIITAPYKDGEHRTPVDCWRFLPDGFRALCKWESQASVIEAFIDDRPHRDCVAIFKIQKE